MNTSHSQQQQPAPSIAGGASMFNNIAPRTREERVKFSMNILIRIIVGLIKGP